MFWVVCEPHSERVAISPWQWQNPVRILAAGRKPHHLAAPRCHCHLQILAASVDGALSRKVEFSSIHILIREVREDRMGAPSTALSGFVAFPIVSELTIVSMSAHALVFAVANAVDEVGEVLARTAILQALPDILEHALSKGQEQREVGIMHECVQS